MLTVRKKLDIRPAYDFTQIAPKERIVFFDIETTGLSASKSGLYLIGAVDYAEGCWRLTQWFAESQLEEEALIRAFSDLLSEKRRAAQKDAGRYARVALLHFNGDMFDIPFIRRVAGQYYLPDPFTGTVSVDLYKKVKPYKAFLRLSDCRLKSVERLCGIEREDKYSGGELIYVYEEYLRLKNLDAGSCEYHGNNLALRDELLRTLLLHNEEDLSNLPLICGVMLYDELFSDQLCLTEAELVSLPAPAASRGSASAASCSPVPGSNSGVSSGEISGCAGERRVLDLHYTLPQPLPAPLSFEDETYVLEAGGELNLAVSLYEGELKYFFPDHRNYYYLPAEDYAVHKSVGEFVDKKARKQATARTCYQKRPGLFLPQPEEIFSPCFYEEYKGARCYAAYSDGLLSEKDRLSRYASAVLRHFLGLEKQRQKDGQRRSGDCF